MHHRFIHCIVAAIAVLMFASHAQAQPFIFDKIADQATGVPGQAPETFVGFHAPSLAGPQVSVDGFYGAGPFPPAAFLKDGANPIAGVFDGTTGLPGQAPEVFSSIGSPGDVNAGGTTVFHVLSGDVFKGGIYTGTAGGPPVTIVDNLTPLPGGGGNFGSISLNVNPSIDTNGNVAFMHASELFLWNGISVSKIVASGDPIVGKTETISFFPNGPVLRGGDIVAKANNSAGQGIYRISGGLITPLADQDATLPGSASTFATVNAPSFDGTNTAFLGTGSGGEQGIYLFAGGGLVTVADLTTTIPGTANQFTALTSVAIDGDNVVFRGAGPGGIQGFYLYKISDMSLVKIIDETEMLDGSNIGDTFGLNMQPNGLSGGRFGFHAVFDGGTQAVYVTDVGSTPPAEPDTIKVTVGMGLVAPGDTIRIPVLIDNVDGPNVGGLQMAIVQQTATEAEFVGLEDTGNHPGMTVDSFEVIPGTVNFVLYSSNNSFIPPADPGPIQIATLVYVVDPSAPLGSTNELDIQGLLVGDEFGDEIAIKICPGAINVGIKGDINLDGDVDILDVILMSRILVESDPVPAEGTTGFKIADYNSDGTLDITDLMGMVNQILTTPPAPPGKHLAYGPVRVGLGHVVVMADGRIAVPLVLDGGMSLGGLEAVFRYDPSVLHVDTPVLSDGLSGIHLTSHVSDGVVRVVAFRMDADAVLPGDGRSVVLLPVSVVQGSGSASVTLSEGVGATVHAALASLTYGATVVDVPSIKSSAPASFSLSGNSPNPFNPSTTISYEVPQASHIRLVIYNLIGQEVVQLVNQVQQAGRYTITWDARNAQGVGVSSGVYLYRLVSDTGFSDTRRMTLLK